MRAWFIWSVLLGFALGGFFDGILLHQVLEWHHLLSLVGGDLRFQLLWDGLFHLLMYVLAALALWGLWRARGGAATGRRTLGALLAGFALWQLVDVAGFHWVVGIHRVRLDVPNPLAWDLGWLALFGLLPALGAWALLRRPGGPGAGFGGGKMGGAALGLLALLTVGAGAWAAQPPAGAPFTALLWPAGTPAAASFAALSEADARMVWADTRGGVMLVDVPAASRWRLWRAGALVVGGGGLPAGCFQWSRQAA